MAAHLRDLPRCADCSSPASKELRNTFNAVVGYYCGRHAARALRAFQREHGGNR